MKNMLLLTAVFACFYSEKIDAMSIQNDKECRQSTNLSIPKKQLRKKSVNDAIFLNNPQKMHIEISENQNLDNSLETLAAEQLLCLNRSNSSLIINNTEEIAKLRSVFISYVRNLLKLRQHEVMLRKKIRKRNEELRIWKRELRELQDHIEKTQQEKKSSFLLLDRAKNLTK